MPPALKPLCGVGVAYHHLTGAHSIFQRAGRGPGLKLWGTEPAIPLWYRFISRGKGRSERRLKSQEREKGASTKRAGALRLHATRCMRSPGTWAVPGSARAALQPGYVQTGTHLVPRSCCSTPPSFCRHSACNR